MDPQAFDRIARNFSQSASRRRALAGLVGGALAVVAGATAGEAKSKHRHRPQRTTGSKGGNSACAHFCAAVFGADTPAANNCTSDAAHGAGLCATCAQTNTPADHVCCARDASGVCPDYPTAACCAGADTCGGGPTGTGCGCTPNCTGKTCGDKDGCGGICSFCPVGQTCPQGRCCIATDSPTNCAANTDCCSNICQGWRCVATIAGSCTATADFCADISNLCGSGICGCFQTTREATLCGGAGAANCFDSCAACEAAGGGCVASVGACTLCGSRVECIFPCPPSA